MYYFALESGGGHTVGKRLLRLRVVRSDGSEAGLREVGVRTVLRVVDGLFAYLVGLAVMPATGQRRQRLGDLAAGTVVTSADAEQDETTATVRRRGARIGPRLRARRGGAGGGGGRGRRPMVELVQAEADDEQDHVDEPAAEAPVAVEAGEPPVDEEDEPAWSAEPAGDEPTSVSSGVEMVSAIDLIMAAAR